MDSADDDRALAHHLAHVAKALSSSAEIRHAARPSIEVGTDTRKLEKSAAFSSALLVVNLTSEQCKSAGRASGRDRVGSRTHSVSIRKPIASAP